MTLAIILVTAALISLGVVLRLAVSRGLQISRGPNTDQRIQPIDVEAFRNLINPAEDEYLRRHLQPSQFRVVRRERLLAMAAYVGIAGRNAGVLIQVGEAAIAGGDPRTLEAAQKLVSEALLLRRNTAIAMAKIYFALAWPYSDFAAVRVADRYEQLSSFAMLLGRLQNPAVPVRLSAGRP
jgi:hypothetical protein